MMETGREGWTQEERERYDARADHEEWSHAEGILGPFVQVSREVGNASLSKVMEKALAEVEEEVVRAADMLEALTSVEEPEGVTATTDFDGVLADLMESRGISGIEELVKRAKDAGHRLSVKELREDPRCGFGRSIDAVMGLTQGERIRLSKAFGKSYLAPRIEEARAAL